MFILAKSPVRIPVKLVDGQWEFFYGGAVPVMNGTVGDLVVDREVITDPKFLTLLKRKADHKILDEGTVLLVALTIRPKVLIDPKYASHLIPMRDMSTKLGTQYFSVLRSPDTKFVRIQIGPPLPSSRNALIPEEGGVWLRIQGTQPKSIDTSSVILPPEISEEPLESLNHAFTRLSEVFEPWRKSHTGNIYTRVLYQERNNRWYPLDVLRNAAIAEDEHQLIRDRWAEISSSLNLHSDTKE